LQPYFTSRINDLGQDIQEYVQQGLGIPAVEYIEAQRIRRKARREYQQVWDQVDCIFTPTTPMAAPKIGEEFVEINGVQEGVRPASTRLTRGMNALGLPAISILCGFTRAGLPIGLQIIAGAGKDDVVLRVAAAMEDALGLTGRRPF
jgi:aspartyl-tRNA(Asn)/glutamyl-tRNA(Gln) amidotransferase subunit A